MTFAYQGVTVSEESITGDIIFKLAYNDKINSISAAYSLDGGRTFLQPFKPYSISSVTVAIEPFVELEAGVLFTKLDSCQTGDINGDQAIDLKDVIDGLRLVSNLNPKNICVDGDGKIGLADTVYALRVAAQLIDSGLPH